MWVDVWWQGTLTGENRTRSRFRLATDLKDYCADGVDHFVFALADISEDGSVTDLRPINHLAIQHANQHFLRKNTNLSDISDSEAARKNLGLKNAALLDVGQTAGTVAAGDDMRIVQALQKNQDLSDVPDKVRARENLEVYSRADTDNKYLKLSEHFADVPDKARARTALDVYSTNETNSRYLTRSQNFSDVPDKAHARAVLDVYSRGEINQQFVDKGFLAGSVVTVFVLASQNQTFYVPFHCKGIVINGFAWRESVSTTTRWVATLFFNGSRVAFRTYAGHTTGSAGLGHYRFTELNFARFIPFVCGPGEMTFSYSASGGGGNTGFEGMFQLIPA